MAIKQVKKYYKQVEKMYFEFLHNLAEMQKEFENGECTEDELNNLLTPTMNIKHNYEMLSYVLYLLYEPSNKKKQPTYIRQNKDLYKYFKEKGLLSEDQLLEMSNGLENFKKAVKEHFNHE